MTCAWPPARCGPLVGAGPPLRPGLPLYSPTHTSSRLSTAAGPQAPMCIFWGSCPAPRQLRRASVVGFAARSPSDPGPPPGLGAGDIARPGARSHAGGREGRERTQHGGTDEGPKLQCSVEGREHARRRGGGRGHTGAARGAERKGAPRASHGGARPAGKPSHGSRGAGDGGRSFQGSGGSGGGGYVRMSDLTHLGQLQDAIRKMAGQWVAERDHRSLVAAINCACKLPPGPTAAGASTSGDVASVRRDLLHSLASSLLPLLPSVTRPDHCIIPLWACAKTGYGWTGGGSGGDGPGGEGPGHQRPEAPQQQRQLQQQQMRHQDRGLGGYDRDHGWGGQEAWREPEKGPGLKQHGRWEQGGGGGRVELPLAEALLGRLRENGCALVRKAKPQEHANLWWSLSVAPSTRLVAAHGQLLAASAECLVGAGPDVGEQACSNVLLACARLKHSPTHVPLIHHLTSCLASSPSTPSAQHLANALYALGELREDCGHVPDRATLDQVAGAVVRRLHGGRDWQEAAGGFKPQEVCNTLLGCAKLGLEGAEVVQLLAAAAGAAAGRMKEQELANAVWALGKLLGGAPADAESASAGSNTPAGSVVVAGGYTLGDAHGTASAVAVLKLCWEVQGRLRQGASAFTPQALSNMLYGMSQLQPYIATVHAAAQSAHRGPRGSATFPAAAALAAAAEALAEECVRRSFGGFKPQELANAVWALAKLGHEDQGCYTAAVAAAQQPGFASGANHIIWGQLWYALVLVRHRPPPELAELTARAMAGQSPQVCAFMLRCFAVLGVWEERQAGALLRRLTKLVERQQEQQQHLPSGAGVGAHVTVVEVPVLVDALWGVAMAGPGAMAAHAQDMRVLLGEVARQWEQAGGWGSGPGATRGSFIREGLQQLWQVQLELEAMEGVEGGGSAAGANGVQGGYGSGSDGQYSLASILPGAYGADGGSAGGAALALGRGSLLAAMESAAAQERQGGTPTVSRLQEEVLAALRRLQHKQRRHVQHTTQQSGAAASGPYSRAPTTVRSLAVAILSVQHEALVPALCCRVDMLLELSDGREVAVEVDGPNHYLCNSPHRCTKEGSTKLRDRQLARVFGRGNVACVPYWKWAKVRGDEEAEEEYLWELLVQGQGSVANGAHVGRQAAAGMPAWGQVQTRAEAEAWAAADVEAAAAAMGKSVVAEGERGQHRGWQQGQQEQGQRQREVMDLAGGDSGSSATEGVLVDSSTIPVVVPVRRVQARVRPLQNGSRDSATRGASDGSAVLGGDAAAALGARGLSFRGRAATRQRRRRSSAAEAGADDAGQGGQSAQAP